MTQVGLYYVDCGNLNRKRRFASFEAAERFARNLVAKGKGQPRDVSIYNSDYREVASIDMDALDRIWTDLKS